MDNKDLKPRVYRKDITLSVVFHLNGPVYVPAKVNPFVNHAGEQPVKRLE